MVQKVSKRWPSIVKRSLALEDITVRIAPPTIVRIKVRRTIRPSWNKVKWVVVWDRESRTELRGNIYFRINCISA